MIDPLPKKRKEFSRSWKENSTTKKWIRQKGKERRKLNAVAVTTHETDCCVVLIL